MRQLVFKLCCVMLITSFSIQAQKERIYSKSFETDKETTMILNLDNSSVIIEPSTNGNVEIDHNLEFEGYSKKDIKKLLASISVEAIMFENHITVIATKIPKTKTEYVYNGTGAIFLDNDFKFSIKKDSIVRKSKDSVLKQLRVSKLKTIAFQNNRFKVKESNGKIVNLRDRSSLKIKRGRFVIKIPPFVKLTTNAKNSYITLRDDMINELTIDLKKGALNAKSLANGYNKMKIDDATVRVEHILGGDYTFNNVKHGLIGSVQNAKIGSEFSKIEIGEIAKGTSITDFKSEYWFYNFSNDFKRFDLYSEYSKVHFFYPEFDHSFKVFGNNTINHVGDTKIEMQPNRKGVKFIMMERKPNGKGSFSGHINFDIVHGIIYSHNDSILTINRD